MVEVVEVSWVQLRSIYWKMKHFHLQIVDAKFSFTIVDETFFIYKMYEGRYAYKIGLAIWGVPEMALRVPESKNSRKQTPQTSPKTPNNRPWDFENFLEFWCTLLPTLHYCLPFTPNVHWTTSVSGGIYIVIHIVYCGNLET